MEKCLINKTDTKKLFEKNEIKLKASETPKICQKCNLAFLKDNYLTII